MLPFALGVLGLGGALGLGGRLSIGLQEGKEQRALENYGKRFDAMIAGLDTSTPEGMQALNLRMMRDKEMAGTGSNMLNASLQRAQQGKQWEHEFNNLSAAQSRGFELQQQEQEAMQRVRQEQLSQGWANVGINRKEMQARVGEIQNRMEQLKATGGWTPQQLQEEQNRLATDMGKSVQNYQQALPAYFQTSELLQKAGDDPVRAQASIIGLAKILDPTSVVRTEEGEQLSDSGIFGNVARELNKAKGKGLNREQVENIQGTLDDIVRAQGQQAQYRIQAFEPAARPTALRPGLDYGAAINAQGLYFDPVERRLKQQGQQGGGAATNAPRNPGGAAMTKEQQRQQIMNESRGRVSGRVGG